MYRWLIRGAALLGVAIGLWTGTAHAVSPTMTEEQGRALARWAGLGKEVRFEWEVMSGKQCRGYEGMGNCYNMNDYYNGWYGRDEYGFPLLHIQAGINVPYEILQEVIFHEVGHYKQDLYTGDNIDSLGFPYLEWEADTQALNALCTYYHNSTRAIDIVHEAWKWLADKFQYTGDWSHGTTMQRMTWAVEHAQSCVQHLETP